MGGAPERGESLRERGLEKIRFRLRLLNVLRRRPALGEVAGIEQVERVLDVVGLTRAGKHEVEAGVLDGNKQVMGNIDALYAYLKGRSDGAITKAHVEPMSASTPSS